MARGSELPSDMQGLGKAQPVSRRRFMTASAAAAAGYTVAAGLVRAQAITTDTNGLEAGDAAVEVTGGKMPVYFARPWGVAHPPVILVAMEIFGLHTYVKDVARRLAKLGALAIAPDYYFRSGSDLAKIGEISALRPLVNAKPDAELIGDLDATVRWAAAQGGDTDRLGIIGFCRGGRTVWIYSAQNNGLKAGVAFYGSLVDPPAQKALWPYSPMDLAADMKAPVLGLYGAADQGIPVNVVEEMKAKLAAAGKAATFKIYPEAPHGFHADYRPSFKREAAEDAWAQAATWFRRYGVLD